MTGKGNRWLPDPIWHDVSYDDPHGYGLGVIARDVSEGLFFMDSVREGEHEWVYAEPFGWQGPRELSEDFAVRLTLVPHGPGEGAWRTTVEKLSGRCRVVVSSAQLEGGPPIDSDRDGLPDLKELQLTTNPTVPDTDLDGIPDGEDVSPLTGTVLCRGLVFPEYEAVPTNAPQTVAEVKRVKGVPTLVVNQEPCGPMILTRCAASYEQLAEFGDINYGVHFEMVGHVGWPGEQVGTFRRLDGRLNRFLDEIPNAKIILRLYVCAPKNIARDFPDEIIRFNDGSATHFTKWYAMKDRPLEERGYPSFASEIWRRNTAEGLFRYVTHVRQSARLLLRSQQGHGGCCIDFLPGCETSLCR